MFGELSLTAPASEREHKLLPPPFSGYELRACRGLLGIFVPCYERNEWVSPLLDYARWQVGAFEVCCWPGSEYKVTQCQQRRGNHAFEVRGRGVYFPHEVTQEAIEHEPSWAGWDPSNCGDVFGLESYGPAKEEDACSAVFTFSLDLRVPAGSLFEIGVYRDSPQKEVLATKTGRGTGFWQRDGVNVQFGVSEPTGVLLSIRRHPDCPMDDKFVWYVDGVGVSKGKHNSSWISGERDYWFLGDRFGSGGLADQGLRWTGDAYASPSVRDWWTHQGGELVYLKDTGFRVTGHRGLGDAPRQHVTSPYALRPGTYHQRQRYRHREFQIRGQLTTTDLFELHERRQFLSMLGQKFLTDDETPLRMRYQLVTDDGRPVGRELLIDCRCVSGMGGRVASDYGEEIELSFVADSPYIFEDRQVVRGKQMTTESLKADPETGQHIFIENEGDAPSPFYIEIIGEGRLLAVQSVATDQRFDLDWTLPGNGFAVFAPNETNHRSKAVWNDYGTGEQTSLLPYVKAGGHLPILELAPTTLCRRGLNDICFLWDTSDGAPPVDVAVRVFSRHSFYSVDAAALSGLDLKG